MTVNSTTNRAEYSGNGSTTEFAVSFYFLADADLKVYLRDAEDVETLQTISTDYSVTGAANPSGGAVTMVTAPASGEELIIVRAPAITQLTDYQENDAFPAETHERALDRLTMIAQRVDEQIERTIRLSETDSISTLTLPSDRGGALLGFDTDGNMESVSRSTLDGATIPETTVDNTLPRFAGTDGNAIQNSGIVVDDSNNVSGVNDLAVGGVQTNSGQLRLSQGADVATATTVTLGDDGNYFELTGTTTVAGFATLGIGTTVRIKAVGVFDLTHSANLVCPGGDDITTQAGDTFDITEIGAAQWEISNYQRVASAPFSGVSFQEPYNSGELAISSSGSHTLAHGFGVEPFLITTHLVCKIAENGYSVGEKFPVNAHMQTRDDSAHRGHTLLFDATNIYVRFAFDTNVYIMLNDSTRFINSGTNANWRLVVTALALDTS